MKSVLVVDDSNTTRSLIKSAVGEINDINTFEASTGFEALKALPQQPLDLIILDINMPDINGLELLNFVKNDNRYKNIPVVIVSTEHGKKDIDRGIASGAFAYLTKPFKIEELQDIVKKALSL